MGKRSLAEAEIRERRAVQLKIAGLTYQQIADTPVGDGLVDEDGDPITLYATATGAWDAVQRSLKKHAAEFTESLDELRTLELERLDALFRAHSPKALKGDDKATNQCLRIMEARRKYVGGLEAPQKVQMDVSSDEQTLAALSILSELKSRPALSDSVEK